MRKYIPRRYGIQNGVYLILNTIIRCQYYLFQVIYEDESSENNDQKDTQKDELTRLKLKTPKDVKKILKKNAKKQVQKSKTFKLKNKLERQKNKKESLKKKKKRKGHSKSRQAGKKGKR